ncbi:hypothetical protein ABT120_61440 [Nonomuraea angiospora]|uniref:hypothetical protein n=1 Tax=Nonomuraea angiospora TaxID=46172 RepID=UPI00332B408E
MTRRPPRLTRAHAVALLLPVPAGQPAHTVLTLTDDATFAYATPEAVWLGHAGRIVLTSAELSDAEIRVVPGTGGRLAPGCATRQDHVLASLNEWLAGEHPTAGTPRSRAPR